MKKQTKITSLIVSFVFLCTTLFGSLGPVGIVHANSRNLIENPGFEERDSDTGNARNWENAHLATGDALTDKYHGWTSPDAEMYQNVKIPTTGMYTLSAMAHGTGDSEKTLFGIRTQNGKVIESVVVHKDWPYKKYEITDIYLVEGQRVQVFYGKGTSWSHIDDVVLLRDDTVEVNFVRNPEFESGLEDWNIESEVKVVEDTVQNVAYITTTEGAVAFQTITVPMKAKYKLSAKLLDEKGKGKFGIRKTNKSDVKHMIIPATSEFQTQTIENIELAANEQVEVYVLGSEIKAYEFQFVFDFDKFDNHVPQALKVVSSGDARINQKLYGSYEYKDDDDHLEANTRVGWLIADTKDGKYIPIDGAAESTYTTTYDQKGKYIKYEVTPSDLFGGKGVTTTSAAVGPLMENLIKNASFEDEKLGWKYMGVYTYKSENAISGNRISYIDPGEGNEIYQRIIIPDTGYYNLSAYIKAESEGAKFGIRTPGGNDIKGFSIPQNGGLIKYEINDVLLEKNQIVEVYFKGISKEEKWIEMDHVDFIIDSSKTNISSMSNIITFEVPHQVDVAAIDTEAHNVVFTMPYGTDVTALVPKVLVSKGATVTPASNQTQDFTVPVAYTVTDKDGIQQQWMIECRIAEKEITIDSSSTLLKEAFDSAKPKAKQYVRTDKYGLINRDECGTPTSMGNYMPSYWAGYAHRYAFYSRDMAHQMSGAHLLGLDCENFEMLKAFAGTSNEERKWYPVWAINFDGSIFDLDYWEVDEKDFLDKEDAFVREVPAVFELVEKGYKMYMWTGESRYIDDPVLWNYYTKALTDFIALHDTNNPNGIAEGAIGGGIFWGTATYNERGNEGLIEAGDGIACQYQAMSCYANMLEAKGETEKAKEFAQKASDLKQYFNTKWSVEEGTDEYIRGYNDKGEAFSGFGREQSWFMPMKGITEPGERTNALLADLYEKCLDPNTAPPNIEAISYLPDTFFPYGKNEEGWHFMKHILSKIDEPHEMRAQGTNGDYPEISYTVVSQTVEGLMGVTPNAPKHSVATISRLPEEIDWVALDHIAVGNNDIYVRHDGQTKSTLKNNSGDKITWEVQFEGQYPSIRVNGETSKAYTKKVNGVTVTYQCVDVYPGTTAVAQPSTSKPGSGGSSSHNGSSSSSSSSKVEAKLEVKQAEDGTVKIKTKPIFNKKTGVAEAKVTREVIKDALKKCDKDEKGVKQLIITVPTVDGAKEYVQIMPKDIFAAQDGNTVIRVATPVGTVDLPSNMFGENDIKGDNLSMIMAQVDPADMDETTKRKIGNRPVIQLEVKSGKDSIQWNNPNVSVKVSIDYEEPTEQELKNPDNIIIWYVDGEGHLITLPSGRYDVKTGKVSFEVTHFSQYAVGFDMKTFEDIAKYEWARKSIETLAVRGIVGGVSENRFDPDVDVTRADFMKFLVRVLGVTTSFEENFTDVSVSDDYYQELGIAKALGLARGVDETSFNPNASITREDMMVLLVRALRFSNHLDKNADKAELSRFRDEDIISAYAKDSVEIIVQTGLIRGNGTNINPKGNTTRAEAAVVIKRIYDLQ